MKKQLLLNLFKNHSWLEIGLESLWVAIVLEYTQQPFTYLKVDPPVMFKLNKDVIDDKWKGGK